MQLQENVSDLTEKVEMLKSQIAQRQRDKMKCQLTKGQLSQVPKEQNAFVGIGRMFLKGDREELEKTLTTTADSMEIEIPKLSKALEELQKKKEAAEKELREMIGAFKRQTEGA